MALLGIYRALLGISRSLSPSLLAGVGVSEFLFACVFVCVYVLVCVWVGWSQ